MRYSTSWNAVFNPQIGDCYFDRADAISFDPLSTLYITGNAWWLAELSRWIYNLDGMSRGNRALPHRYLSAGGLREVAFFSRKGTHCALIESDDDRHESPFAVLVFRGSSEPRNWLTNAVTMPMRDNVHRGYDLALDQVWAEVLQSVEPLSCPVFYTGHSMGAALATLAARRKPPQAVYSFGSPQVGKPDLARSFENIPLFRVINYRDMASRIPSSRVYAHVGELIYISHDCELWLNPHHTAVSADRKRGIRVITRELNLGRNIRIPEPVSDHAPVNYVAHLERLALHG